MKLPFSRLGNTCGPIGSDAVHQLEEENAGLKAQIEELSLRLEREHAESKLRLQFALKSAQLSWWDWSLDEDLVRVTSAGACLLGEGCSRSRSREGWMGLVHPDDKDEVCRTLEDCLEGRSPEWRCEHRFYTENNEWIWVLNQGMITKRDTTGRPLEMIGVTQNIDAYKRALHHSLNQQNILEVRDELSKVGAWDYDPETGQLLWSDQIYKMLEVPEGFVPTVEATYRMMHPKDTAKLHDAFTRCVEQGEPYDLELRFITATGRDIICRAASRVRHDEKGRIARIVGIFSGHHRT